MTLEVAGKKSRDIDPPHLKKNTQEVAEKTAKKSRLLTPLYLETCVRWTPPPHFLKNPENAKIAKQFFLNDRRGGRKKVS